MMAEVELLTFNKGQFPDPVEKEKRLHHTSQNKKIYNQHARLDVNCLMNYKELLKTYREKTQLAWSQQ